MISIDGKPNTQYMVVDTADLITYCNQGWILVAALSKAVLRTAVNSESRQRNGDTYSTENISTSIHLMGSDLCFLMRKDTKSVLADMDEEIHRLQLLLRERDKSIEEIKTMHQTSNTHNAYMQRKIEELATQLTTAKESINISSTNCWVLSQNLNKITQAIGTLKMEEILGDTNQSVKA
jgi:hypothetical protein